MKKLPKHCHCAIIVTGIDLKTGDYKLAGHNHYKDFGWCYGECTDPNRPHLVQRIETEDGRVVTETKIPI